MGRRHIPEGTKAEARRLRVEEGLGLEAIAERTGISKGTLSALLRDVPLPAGELRARMQRAAADTTARRARVYPGVPLGTERPGRGERAAVARERVAARLAAMGCTVTPETAPGPGPGELVPRSAFVVRTPDGRALRIRVCSTFREKGRVGWHGRPCVRTSAPSRGPDAQGPEARGQRPRALRRWTRADVDAVIGYDADTDTAFVVPLPERPEGPVHHRCTEEDAEAWHRLRLAPARRGGGRRRPVAGTTAGPAGAPG